ncbi:MULTISPECIES: hypothetical protein [unclassified Flavobacterium]|uniref:hypothetical protein n=1 Tax=unclassified Flavobacterium TaxID=196869 RepID=UPI001F145894|nr:MULTISPECIES: hypothetical protein [unclassified Flavobacterium]UMY64344.1 hypothetical protein MKO97_07435 [Flavobacterium sp. HJ-32-4]
MKKLFALTTLAVLLFSCAGEETNAVLDPTPTAGNEVLLLKVDYTTNEFESGKILTFDESTETFTVGIEYQQPSDLGWVKMKYAELNAPLFEGEIHWAGEGRLLFPDAWMDASLFDSVITDDYVEPAAGFDFIFDPMEFGWGCSNAWSAVQSRVKVREYLQSNPDADVKVFLYTPGVGVGDPATWKWIFILKK